MVSVYVPLSVERNDRTCMHVQILEHDCKSEKLIGLTVQEKGPVAGRWFKLPTTGRMYRFNEEDRETYMGQKLMFRSPMTCSTEGGFCTVCTGAPMGVIERSVEPNRWDQRYSSIRQERLQMLESNRKFKRVIKKDRKQS